MAAVPNGDAPSWLLAKLLCVLRVPVLRDHDQPARGAEAAGERGDRRHDLVAARDGERAARAEIVLRIDDDERVAGSDLVSHIHLLKPSPARRTRLRVPNTRR
jgi:hypothetical protein